MPDYQWAVGKGKIVEADYDRSMALTAEQVENEIKGAFSELFDNVKVEAVSDEFKEVYRVEIIREETTHIVYVCAKGTTPGGRSNLQNEQRIQQKAKYLNYACERKKEGRNAICLGVYKHESETIFCAWNLNQSTASPETPISKQIKISTIGRALSEGFVQQMSGSGEYVCAFRREFIYFYLINSGWIHKNPISQLNNHNEDIIEKDDEISIDDDLKENNEAKKERVTGAENVLLYGVPGVGKSKTIQRDYCNDESRMERVVFHPDYTYSDFVGQILPRVEDEKLKYVFTPGPFTKLLAKAWSNPDEKYYLIIEEINRGNAPAIFGEIFQLLDRKSAENPEYKDRKSVV